MGGVRHKGGDGPEKRQSLNFCGIVWLFSVLSVEHSREITPEQFSDAVSQQNFKVGAACETLTFQE